MKRLLFISGILGLFALVGCEKDTTGGVSRTTFYVDLSLKGEEAMTIPVGGTFTDPGYVCTSAGVDVPVTVTGTVDPATPGVYTIKYFAVNSDGYGKTIYRYVGVISPSAAANDLTGTYRRTTNGALAVWTKLADGLYYNSNVGGIAAPGVLYVYVFNIDAYTIVVPLQETAAGPLTCTDAVYTPTPASYKWVVINGGYGTSLRTFNKI